MSWCLCGGSSFAQCHDRRAAAALIRRRFAEALDVRMTFQQCADGALQSALAVTMNDADAFDAALKERNTASEDSLKFWRDSQRPACLRSGALVIFKK